MEVYVNGEEIKWTPQNPNPVTDVVEVDGNPQNNAGFEGLARCQGDCDIDDHCVAGLFCHQVDKSTSHPGCNNPSSWDLCVDPNDFDNLLFLSTGGW